MKWQCLIFGHNYGWDKCRRCGKTDLQIKWWS